MYHQHIEIHFFVILIALLAACRDASMVTMTALTPMPITGLDLTSCLQATGSGSHVDREMQVWNQDGHMTSLQVNVTQSNSQCVTPTAPSFTLDMDLQSENVRVRLQAMDESAYYDAYLPLPVTCLGQEYLLSTWTPGADGTAFAAVFNPHSHGISANVSLGSNLQTLSVQADGQTLTQGAFLVLEVPPLQARYLTSSTYSLDGLVITSREAFAVYAGNLETLISGIGETNHFLDMLPPTGFFQKQYLVPMPADLLFFFLKIIALTPDTRVSATTYSDVTDQTVDQSLAEAGDTWSLAYQTAVSVRSNKPIMVVQYCPEASLLSSASMVLVPPVSEWTWSTLIHPLMDSSTWWDWQSVEIVAFTNQTTQIRATQLSDEREVTSSISFLPIGSSGFSQGTLYFTGNDVIWLQGLDNTTFQVIQYLGGIGSDVRAYSIRAGLHRTCLDSMVNDPETTNATDNYNYTNNDNYNDSNGDNLKLYPFSDTAVYIVAVSICLIMIIVPVSLGLFLVRRGKMGKAGKFMDKSPQPVALERSTKVTQGHQASRSSARTSRDSFRKSVAPRAHLIRVKPVT